MHGFLYTAYGNLQGNFRYELPNLNANLQKVRNHYVLILKTLKWITNIQNTLFQIKLVNFSAKNYYLPLNSQIASKQYCLQPIAQTAALNLSYLFTVKGCREGCCFGIQIMLGELRLGLPNPELLMLFVLLGIPMPCPTWEWFIIFLGFIGNIPLKK